MMSFNVLAMLLSLTSVEVYLCDQTGLKPATLRLIEREVRNPFSKAGLELVWRQGCPDKPMSGLPGAAQVYVLHQFPESLLHTPHFACGGDGQVLGMVLTGKGELPGSVIYISRSAVEHRIRGASIAPSAPKRARALGRVTIHELAHRFLARTRHSTPGILRDGGIRPRELTQPRNRRLRFSQSEVDVLRAMLERSNTPSRERH